MRVVRLCFAMYGHWPICFRLLPCFFPWISCLASNDPGVCGDVLFVLRNMRRMSPMSSSFCSLPSSVLVWREKSFVIVELRPMEESKSSFSSYRTAYLFIVQSPRSSNTLFISPSIGCGVNCISVGPFYSRQDIREHESNVIELLVCFTIYAIGSPFDWFSNVITSYALQWRLETFRSIMQTIMLVLLLNYYGMCLRSTSGISYTCEACYSTHYTLFIAVKLC